MDSSTLYLLVSSADNFCKQFGPRSDPTNVGPDLEPLCLTLRRQSQRIFLKTFNFEKKSADNYLNKKITQHAKLIIKLDLPSFFIFDHKYELVKTL